MADRSGENLAVSSVEGGHRFDQVQKHYSDTKTKPRTKALRREAKNIAFVLVLNKLLASLEILTYRAPKVHT
jgi:hypothetical protein